MILWGVCQTNSKGKKQGCQINPKGNKQGYQDYS